MGIIGDVIKGGEKMTPDVILRAEEWAQSRIAGAMGDGARDKLANWELDDLLDDLFCEDIVE